MPKAKPKAPPASTCTLRCIALYVPMPHILTASRRPSTHAYTAHAALMCHT